MLYATTSLATSGMLDCSGLLLYLSIFLNLLMLSQIRDFASGWRAGIQQMNDDVLLYFSSFHSGMEILKQVRAPHSV